LKNHFQNKPHNKFCIFSYNQFMEEKKIMKYKVIMAMLLLAVFAIGAVSATDDIAIDDNVISEDTDVDVAIDDVVVDEDSDDVAVEDQSSDDSDDNTRAMTYTPFTVTTSSNFTDINNKISSEFTLVMNLTLQVELTTTLQW
jgi:hypothetical protein